MFKADYHVHTAFSCDSEVPMEEMIKTGINKGRNKWKRSPNGLNSMEVDEKSRREPRTKSSK